MPELDTTDLLRDETALRTYWQDKVHKADAELRQVAREIIQFTLQQLHEALAPCNLPTEWFVTKVDGLDIAYIDPYKEVYRYDVSALYLEMEQPPIPLVFLPKEGYPRNKRATIVFTKDLNGFGTRIKNALTTRTTANELFKDALSFTRSMSHNPTTALLNTLIGEQ
jgi:hypothetical protein